MLLGFENFILSTGVQELSDSFVLHRALLNELRDICSHLRVDIKAAAGNRGLTALEVKDELMLCRAT